MSKKKVLAVLALMTIMATSCGKNEEVSVDYLDESESTEQVAPTSEPQPTEELDDANQSYQFVVGEGDYVEHDYTVTADRIPVSSKVVQSYAGEDCIILYDVGDIKLNNYKTEVGIASYSYTTGSYTYYLYVTLENENGVTTYDKIVALQDAGVVALTESCPLGDVTYCVEESTAGTFTYGTLHMDNGYYCTLKFVTALDFDEAVAAMKAVYENGITVILPSEETSEAD